MAESPSSRPTKVIDIQNGEVIQVGHHNKTNTNKIIKNCIININNYYNGPPPPTADTVPARDHTTKPYLRQVQVQVKKKAKNNGRPVTAPGRPRDQGPASHAVKICTRTVVDSEGRVLEPGDVVVIGSRGNCNCGIFVGDALVVRVNKATRKVVKVPLDVKEPFMKWREYVHDYERVERVKQATERVGQVFDDDDLEFLLCCYTDEETVWNIMTTMYQD